MSRVYNDGGLYVAEVWGKGKSNREPIVLMSEHSVTTDDLTIMVARVYKKNHNPKTEELGLWKFRNKSLNILP